jgi:hypothetical protein
MTSKGPKTISGAMRKIMTGDGRKKSSSLFGNLFGDSKKKKK